MEVLHVFCMKPYSVELRVFEMINAYFVHVYRSTDPLNMNMILQLGRSPISSVLGPRCSMELIPRRVAVFVVNILLSVMYQWIIHLSSLITLTC